MKRIAALLLVLLPLASWAAPPTEASVRKLLEVSHAERTMNQTLDNMRPVLSKSINSAIASRTASLNLTGEQKRILATLPDRLDALLHEEISYAKMLPHLMQIYHDIYDQSDIDGLIAFYQSPVGQHFSEKQPVVMQKIAEFLIPYETQEVMPRVMALVQQVFKEAKLSPPAPKTAPVASAAR